MKVSDRQKMCVNCDGRIPIDASLCLYCNAEQGVKEADIAKPIQSLQDSLSSLYTPPYSVPEGNMKKNYQEAKEKKFTMPSPIGMGAEVTEEKEEIKGVIFPLLLLAVGGILFTLGLIQLFFSDGNKLQLEWDSAYWYVYCLFALPLVLLGLKKAASLK